MLESFKKQLEGVSSEVEIERFDRKKAHDGLLELIE
jgi:hypothetical protein